ncbi:hypothetical protein MJO28_002075 [Puccinia striiformis f. sp. tritici]|uniref:Uncharacterized protein n=1 Tax=Puccinia striiformis f. sp. tritici TaxID=168172 RepID=A0ACC0EVR6_9BASI|nr:hypothetical protein MJO28_002075 [Puccinia striiformis f. sp. tritici]
MLEFALLWVNNFPSDASRFWILSLPVEIMSMSPKEGFSKSKTCHTSPKMLALSWHCCEASCPNPKSTRQLSNTPEVLIYDSPLLALAVNYYSISWLNELCEAEKGLSPNIKSVTFLHNTNMSLQPSSKNHQYYCLPQADFKNKHFNMIAPSGALWTFGMTISSGSK